MARDVQQSKVYAWEKIVYSLDWASDRLTETAARALIRKIHQDVIEAGGDACSPYNLDIKFTKRTKPGSAKWGEINLHAGKVNVAVVLHEVAHMLTYGVPAYVNNRHHVDLEGHGPKFTACMIALFEHYLGRDPEHALYVGRRFDMAGQPRKGALIRVETRANGKKYAIYEAIPTRTSASIRVSNISLTYWRELFARVPRKQIA